MEPTAEAPRKPGECIPWSEKVQELPPIQGDAELAERIWREIDELAYTYIWHCLVSF